MGLGSDHDDAQAERSCCKHRSKQLCSSTSTVPPPSLPRVSKAQGFPSSVVSSASVEAMKEDVEVCLTGASVVDLVVQEESVPVLAEAVTSAALAVVDDANASSQSVVEEDNAASQDCPSLPFSSHLSGDSIDLLNALGSIQDDSLAALADDTSNVGASSTCTSFSDQLHADRLQKLLLSELPLGSVDSDVESAVH